MWFVLEVCRKVFRQFPFLFVSWFGLVLAVGDVVTIKLNVVFLLQNMQMANLPETSDYVLSLDFNNLHIGPFLIAVVFFDSLQHASKISQIVGIALLLF